MENASKALIIAGAILISILLISLGIIIYNQASDALSGSGMSDIEIQNFNQKFLQFEGTKNGAQLKTLVQNVRVNNANEDNKGVREVTINAPASIQKNGEIDTSLIKTNKRYKISMTPEEDGLIKTITVEEATTT